MVQLGWRAGLIALARNQAHRVTGGALRGGHRVAGWSQAERDDHCREIVATLSPGLGDVTAQVGLEIGPGDNLGVCRLLVEHGCRRMLALEKFCHPTEIPERVVLQRQRVEDLQLDEPVDFALSNDVLEHVDDVRRTMQRVFAALKPGGLFVSSVDLRGHNMFRNPARPLDHLTAPDWLYRLLTSHIVTSNRVRCSELVDAALRSGFVVECCEAQATANPAYLKLLRPHLLAGYRSLKDSDLEVLQVLLVLRRPAAVDSDASPAARR
jgi:SAM-dependent methyltransferase